MSKGKKIAVTCLVLILTALISSFLYVFYSYQSIVDNKTDGIPVDSGKKNYEDNEPKIDYKEIEGVTNILLLGTDERTTNESPRSDTMMILTIDDIHKKIKLTSIMRDTYTKIPGHSEQKINHAFAYGGKDLLMKTIENNFEIKLDKYVMINFSGFKDLVNAIDGLDINVKSSELNELNRCILLEMYEDPNIKDSAFKSLIERNGLLKEYGPAILKNPNLSRDEINELKRKVNFVESVGMQHLEGQQVLAYSRMRKLQNGSYGRTERQRNVVNMIIDKLKDTSLLKYNSVAQKLFPYVKTNIEFTQAIDLAYTICKINNFNIDQLQIPTEKLSYGRIYRPNGQDKGWVLLMDKQANTKILHDFVFEDKSYNESEYRTFSYLNSEYYYEEPKEEPKEEEENKEDGSNSEESGEEENIDEKLDGNEDIDNENTDNSSDTEESVNDEKNGDASGNEDKIDNGNDEGSDNKNTDETIEDDFLKDLIGGPENKDENSDSNTSENIEESTESDILTDDDNTDDKNQNTEEPSVDNGNLQPDKDENNTSINEEINNETSEEKDTNNETIEETENIEDTNEEIETENLIEGIN